MTLADQHQSGRDNVLLQAIRDQDTERVRHLLSVGFKPDGVPLRLLSHNAACYLRHGPTLEVGDMPAALSAPYYQREHVLPAINQPQLTSIQDDEVEDRFQDCVARFWTGVDFPSRNVIPYSDTMPAVIEAAQGDSVAIVDLLCDAGADTSFWKTHSLELPMEATPSSLAISTPLHAAVWTRNSDMLDHLLKSGFCANAMPLANPTKCITTLMAMIVYCNPWNKEAFHRLLRDSGSAGLQMRTPVFNVHILHFAVARLDPELLRCVSGAFPLASAGVTALGHTLLHIACLPLNEQYVEMNSQAIYDSIHEMRSLSEESAQTAQLEHRHPADDYIQARENVQRTTGLLNSPFTAMPPRFTWPPPSVEYFDQQIETVESEYSLLAWVGAPLHDPAKNINTGVWKAVRLILLLI